MLNELLEKDECFKTMMESGFGEVSDFKQIDQFKFDEESKHREDQPSTWFSLFSDVTKAPTVCFAVRILPASFILPEISVMKT